MKQNLFVKEIPCISSFIAHDISPKKAFLLLYCFRDDDFVSRSKKISFQRIFFSKTKVPRKENAEFIRSKVHCPFGKSIKYTYRHVNNFEYTF